MGIEGAELSRKIIMKIHHRINEVEINSTKLVVYVFHHLLRDTQPKRAPSELD